MGDFNFPDINWSALIGSSHLSNMFCDFAFDCNLIQLVNSPTHSMGNCLDLVLTNSPESVGHIDISSHPLIQSDHFIISFSLVISAHISIFQSNYHIRAELIKT